MISEQDLRDAIIECQNVRNPNANTCIKLASYYTIMAHMYHNEPNMAGYSYALNPDVVAYDGESEFAHIIEGRDSNEVWKIMDELVTTLQVINPRLYNGVMRKLRAGV